MVGLPEGEAWTRDCLRAALPGCAVDQDDDNSVAGMYDLAITYQTVLSAPSKSGWPRSGSPG